MATTTIGVKVDESLRERLHLAASRIGRTSHWLHKQALHAYIEKIERGEIPPELHHAMEEQFLYPTDSVQADTPHAIPFVEFAQDIQPQSVLRAAITSAYRRPEQEALPLLLEAARCTDKPRISELASKLVASLRNKRSNSGVEVLLQEFSLSSQEGIALMCLAEALLRIPDSATRDALIRDKISHGDWKSHMGGSPSLFVNAATWGLMLTGKLVSVSSEKSLSNAITRLISKGGEPLVRKGVNMAMRLMGEQFVSGQTIAEALANSAKSEAKGFGHSYDMLGEAAMDDKSAKFYYKLYEQAIHAIGKHAAQRGIYEGPGISIKLSALHPRYSRSQRERVMVELLPDLLCLARLARSYDIGLNIDAEEADRLELSLDLLEALCFDPSLASWHGIGFVVQAYQKRAPFVIDYLIDLGRRSHHRLMVRLVKGAYWDSEIKRAQIDGLEGYPVFTRKVYTDVSYLACARKLLAAPDAIFPQFATHNAQTVASIYYMAGENFYKGQYEFQCLHGMGEPLYEEVTGPLSDGKLNRPCRIYAPVGTHQTLLAYLVRRLLENGANTSFVNRINDESVPIASLVQDPVDLASRIAVPGLPHDQIPLPRELFGSTSIDASHSISTGAPSSARLNSSGIDLSNEHRLGSLAAALLHGIEIKWTAQPIITDLDIDIASERFIPVLNPADTHDEVGRVAYANHEELDRAIQAAKIAAPIWQSTPVSERSAQLIYCAQILESEMQTLIGLIVREAGKSIPNAISEIREATDFLRYYAQQAVNNINNSTHRALGPVLCISPWNFPLAIFIGQVAAALAAGNVVIAKPAEQTSLIAAQAIRILHQAGVPRGALQLITGPGESVGAKLVACEDIRGVIFTGSTEVARTIACTLSERLNKDGQPIPFIAETGGINAMVVDSSALPEQVVADTLTSAFDSAGQRCSALRLLCLQEDSADQILEMLHGAMRELRTGNSDRLSTDIGPIIDAQAKQSISQYINAMRDDGHPVTQIELSEKCHQGYFVSPTIIELNTVEELNKEVFGPVLHVVRYKRKNLDQVIHSINQLGYGLTFGIHSRIDETVQHVLTNIKAGNIYVNRNVVGAVVGVQPFGGSRLSGTGPKAGGPLYLLRLVTTQAATLPVTHSGKPSWPLEMVLAGPTGERNLYTLQPRGQVFCIASTEIGLTAQYETILETGNSAIWVESSHTAHWIQKYQPEPSAYKLIKDHEIESTQFQSVLFEGDTDELKKMNIRIAARSGPIAIVQSRSCESLAAGEGYRIDLLLQEQSISTNTAAAGGNASLMTIG